MRVIETSLDEDLSLFSGYLWQQRVPHRVYEERGRQVLEVADVAHVDPVRAAYGAWKSGRLTLSVVPGSGEHGRWWAALARYPGLTALIALAVLVFPFSYPLGDDRLTEVASWLTIVDLRQPPAALPSLQGLLVRAEVWRWFTPMLLHFSVLHLGFNCAITIELGRRVERRLGAAGLWLLVLVLAGGSNLTQYAFGGGPLFGGLSGVAYGLLGFVMTMGRLLPTVGEWQFPPALGVALLAFLVIFSSGITEPFGLFVANAAHWAGLLGGVAAGLVLGGLARGRSAD